jgi:radical SAM-linked protein
MTAVPPAAGAVVAGAAAGAVVPGAAAGAVRRGAAAHPQRPVVQRLRVRYAKRGRLRFASVRDFQRALERALRRADLPVAYSQGFSPHPRISYMNAVPTGVASEAEYVEIALHSRCEPDEVARALDACLPAGLDVVAVAEAAPGPALGEMLTGPSAASEWLLRFPDVTVATLAEALESMLACDSVLVPRVTKSGRTTVDVRAAIVRAQVRGAQPDEAASTATCAILQVVVRHGTPSVRPDDVLVGLHDAAGLAPPVPPLATRLAQGPLDEQTGSVVDPLA